MNGGNFGIFVFRKSGIVTIKFCPSWIVTESFFVVDDSIILRYENSRDVSREN